jgi:hypothetical protein
MHAPIPTQYSDPAVTYSVPLGIAHDPYFWVTLAILLLSPVVFLLQHYSKKGLFIPLLPTTSVNVRPHAPGETSTLERISTLCL